MSELSIQLRLFAIATGPALLVFIAFARLNARQPQPVGRLWRVSLAGALAAVACGALELGLARVLPGLRTWAGALLHAFVVAALLEESAKLASFRLIAARRPELDTRFNAMLSGVAGALGFALVENVLYFEKLRGSGHLLETMVVRALLSVPMHALCTGLGAWLSSRGRLDGVGPGWPGGLALAVLLHGAYDAALFATPLVRALERPWLSTLTTAVPLAIVFVGLLELHHRATLARQRDLAATPR